MKDDKGRDPNERDGEGRELRSRSESLTVREKALGVREASINERESAMSRRELLLTEREELALLRSDALRAREEAREAAVARDRLFVQMREANEKLLVATVRAEEAADEANTARLEIAKSEERFRSLVTTSAAVVWRANAEGCIHLDPDSWRRFTGMDVEGMPDEEPGSGWLRAVHPDDRDQVRAAWVHAAATRTAYTHQHRLRRRDGSYAWVTSRAVPIPESGAVHEWIGTMTDISDRIRVEEARERFIAILGHDLRSPVGAILMSVEVLLGDDLPERSTKTVAGIRERARGMEAVIRDVLDFARGRLGGGIPVKRTWCDLGRICDEEVDEMTQAHPGRAIHWGGSGNLIGEWDADRVAQVLSNLIGNAVQHGTDPIRIAAEDEGDEVVLSVRNGGAAIPASMIPQLFEPFRASGKDAAEGLGLGLYIVSEIVRAHGGNLSARSAEGEGTTFTIRWPRHAPAARASEH